MEAEPLPELREAGSAPHERGRRAPALPMPAVPVVVAPPPARRPTDLPWGARARCHVLRVRRLQPEREVTPVPRIRSIKPEFFDSPGTTKASPYARLLYIAMWCWADDWGIGDANPRRLLGFAFPEDDASEVQPRNFRHLAAEVSDCYGVRWYHVAGRDYYAVPSWEDHQRTEKRAKKRFPGPDQAEHELFGETAEVPSLDRGSSVVGKGKGEQGNRGKGAPLVSPTRGEPRDAHYEDDRNPIETVSPETLLPRSFGASTRHKAFAMERGLDIAEELAAFKDHARAN